MSLTATHSMSAFAACPARKTLRPMRPKPLIPTRTGMLSILPPWRGEMGAGRRRTAGDARRDREGYPTDRAAGRRLDTGRPGDEPGRSGRMGLEHAQPDGGGRRAAQGETARGQQRGELLARALAPAQADQHVEVGELGVGVLV